MQGRFRLNARPAAGEALRSSVAASNTVALSDAAPRPASGRGGAAAVGKVQPLGVAAAAVAAPQQQQQRDGFFFVPSSYDPSRPSPLVVMLHGAGGRAWPSDPFLTFGGLDNLSASSCILVVPESRGSTWDAIRGGFGPDVACIDRALAKVFSSYAVDPSRVALAGFSDGATYALSLALPNGDLFTHVLAYSPGFMRPPMSASGLYGRPRVFVSHGVRDEVLPVGCSRSIVARLRESGYEVLHSE